MNVDEFEALMDRCKIMLNDNGEVSFVPYSVSYTHLTLPTIA